MVSNAEANLAQGQNKRSAEVVYTIQNQSVIIDGEVEGLIECEILMCMEERTMPMGVRDVPLVEDSLDKRSL